MLQVIFPIDEKHTYSKEYLEAIITYALGGRAAEKIVFNHYTTGAGDDIEKATGIARKMVCEWGMSDKLGPLSYGAKEEEIFLGREIQKHRDYSEKTAIEIDEEISKIVKLGMERAEKILEDNMEILHKLSKELLEREILDGHEIDTIIKGEELPPVPENGKGEASAKNEESAAEVPEHVKKMIDKRKDKDTAPKDDSN